MYAMFKDIAIAPKEAVRDDVAIDMMRTISRDITIDMIRTICKAIAMNTMRTIYKDIGNSTRTFRCAFGRKRGQNGFGRPEARRVAPSFQMIFRALKNDMGIRSAISKADCFRSATCRWDHEKDGLVSSDLRVDGRATGG